MSQPAKILRFQLFIRLVIIIINASFCSALILWWERKRIHSTSLCWQYSTSFIQNQKVLMRIVTCETIRTNVFVSKFEMVFYHFPLQANLIPVWLLLQSHKGLIMPFEVERRMQHAIPEIAQQIPRSSNPHIPTPGSSGIPFYQKTSSNWR